MDRLLTIKEVSEMLGLHIVTIRQWTAAGKIPFVKLSPRAVRYRQSVIEALIKSKEVNYGGFSKAE